MPKVRGESYEPNVALLELESVQNRGTRLVVPQRRVLQSSGFPANDAILARLAEYKVAVPLYAVDVIPVHVACRKVGKVLQNRLERSPTPRWVPEVRLLDGLLHVGLLQRPQLQRVIHSAGDNALALHVEIRAQHLVAMSLHAAENGNANVRLDVPQAQRVILGGGQQDVWISRMNLEFVDGVTVADVVLDARHGYRAYYSNDAATTGNRQQRLAALVVAPSASVEILLGIRIGVALAQTYAAAHGTLVNADAIAAHRGKDHWLTFLQVVIELHAEQRQPVILPDARAVLVQCLLAAARLLVVLLGGFAATTTLPA